jgi:hypothetical protein
MANAHSVKYTGWPTFIEVNPTEWAPHIYGKTIEAWLGAPRDGASHDSSHSDYWRASLDGSLYLIRGYSEDGLNDRPPGKLIDFTLPIWRVGEALLFASRYARFFEGAESIVARCHYTDLRNPQLTSLSGGRAVFERDSQTDEVTLYIDVPLNRVRDNLIEVLHDLLRPLYEIFGFMELPINVVREEIKE